MLVLDANILIRAVLGSRVLFLLRKYSNRVEFLAPDLAFEEAREHLPRIMVARGVPAASAMATLDLVAGLVNTVASETYSPFEGDARQRIDGRDHDDCPIWTEDTDFFGCGVATWTTDRVELFLAKASEKQL
jgi:predicted nucleic acid-binding protein